MFKRLLNLVAVGAVASVALFGTVMSADAGGCGCCNCQAPAPQPVYYPPPQVYYPPPPPPPVYRPLPVYYQQPVYAPAPPLCAPRRSWLDKLFSSEDYGQCGPQPVPVYIVNQGPTYSGPNLTVYPPPYGEPEPQPYPVVGANYHSERYFDRPVVYPRRSYRKRVSVRYTPRRASIRVRY